MVRGTTPTHSFSIPFDTSEIDELFLTYSQNGQVVFEKQKEDCELIDNEIRVHLTQDDTLLLSDKKQTEIQLAVKTRGGDVFRSNIINVSTERILHDDKI